MKQRPFRAARGPLFLALLATLSAGVLSGGAAIALDQQAGTAHPALWPQLRSPLKPDPKLEARIDALLARMSPEEKVGQVVQADIASVTPDDLKTYRLGSILAGGSSDPGGQYNAPASAWLALADDFYAASMETSGGKYNAIPVIFGVDAVHGHNNVVGATLFPHNIGLGATHDPALMGQIAQATAAEMRATGIDWTFAPTLAVPQDDRWGRTYEGYSENPDVVRAYAGPLIQGLQGKPGSKDFLKGAHVVATAKHFLADGGTFEGRDQGDARIDEATLRDVHGAGYPPALKAGVQAVMVSFSSWNGVKMSGNASLLDAVLKQRMGFDGFVVSDWNGHAGVPGGSRENCVPAFVAGVDMIMAPDTWKGCYEHLLAAEKGHALPAGRLDEAVRRILRVKFRAGMFEAGKPSTRGVAGRFDLLGSAEHRAIARRAVRESLVLLKNNGGVLPLDPRAKLLVAGDGADDMMMQSGGWTLSWQGTGLKPEDFPHAQTIAAALREQVARAGGQVELAADGRYTHKPDAAVVVFGETPYAEFQGDLKVLAYRPGDDRDLKLLRKLKAEGIPVVAVFLSGRPLWMNREINAADAFVAAWLPGSEGGGVADVLLRDAAGKVQHDFRGTLSYSWPRTAVQTPLNVGQPGYDPQFAYGYGLTYAKPASVPALSEDAGMDLASLGAQTFFERGTPATGWTLRVQSVVGKPRTLSQPSGQRDAPDVAIAPVDYKAQEDAWKITWKQAGEIALLAPRPLDLVRETNGNVMLRVTLRVDAAPSQPGAELFLECGPGCSASLPIDTPLAKAPRGAWGTLGIPLKCFAARNAQMGQVSAPLGWRMPAGTVLSVHEVGLGTEAQHVLDCAAK
ncbi:MULTISPECIES: glycoside hydrolase family 3 protein [Pseudoxanthomonas]|uniref:Beta-glucosidase n=1 Tax=Pseudoxanthomonas winnipegensis TaxID=2480810 RepID=A0AAW8GDZ6_9GAMM|nr:MULTISPECIES: glycoside hydrolase family 3 protein [Pseudoxanthomonas]MDQ1119358.1 beta-glucosidase [Pseudoxanthomonas winnipegensis]MDQ1132554.1 beta-glucosidase [Pseudoxanthomonas winnipegensis]MDR6137439.1 beta-glucosidase [Pseudoxanthomonas sp. SORGH_AS_0997]